jgi:hypothetical protein
MDTTSVYWTDNDSGLVRKLSLGGGTPITLASGQMNTFDIAIYTTNIYWAVDDADSRMILQLGW